MVCHDGRCGNSRDPCRKQGNSALSATEKTSDGQTVAKIDFRDEQKAAIEQTIKAFKKENEMLWYAKMRFGKTLTALEVVRRSPVSYTHLTLPTN